MFSKTKFRLAASVILVIALSVATFANVSAGPIIEPISKPISEPIIEPISEPISTPACSPTCSPQGEVSSTPISTSVPGKTNTPTPSPRSKATKKAKKIKIVSSPSIVKKGSKYFAVGKLSVKGCKIVFKLGKHKAVRKKLKGKRFRIKMKKFKIGDKCSITFSKKGYSKLCIKTHIIQKL